MSKYKKGDKIVVTHSSLKTVYSDVYTIDSVHETFVWTVEAGSFYYPWIELELIYNSPLGKALE